MSVATPLFDVALIGYGPCGALLANQLGLVGLSVLVLEKDADIYPLPRAIHFDGEVMRVFQNAGLRGAVEAISRPGIKGMHFVNAAGETLLIRGGTSLSGPHGCANNYYFHQPELEAVLREGARRFANVDVRLSHEVTALNERGDSVDLAYRDAAGVDGMARARYVIGCDGARSMVRKHIGGGSVDLGLHQPWLVFDVILGDNAPALPDHTVQHCDPARPMTYCNVTGRRRRWEIMLMPGDDLRQLVQPATLWRLVSRWIQPEQAVVERAVIYTFHSVIAQKWRAGRLLIAGDAAHQTPPFLGQGMCAAVRDAANLAWKLTAVLRGLAPESLLDSYETERKPHVQAFIELAVRLGDIIQATDPEKARERDAKFASGQPEIFEFPSPGLGPGLLHGRGEGVGLPFIQPRLRDGALLDERMGARFGLVAPRALLHTVAPRADLALVAGDDEPALGEWLSARGVQAVLIRPDRYVLGVAHAAAELPALLDALPTAAAQ